TRPAGCGAGACRWWRCPGPATALRTTRRETARLSGAPVLRSRRLVDPGIAARLVFGARALAAGGETLEFDDD
ncbi:hypothetical protein, partial [Caulobacter sp. 17J65-9]|uniref:hypothetical protein n=1 Tax=Caulobacter sp. 17J65-9 TaxID=2709382 RepID=UPI001969F9D0